MGGERIWIKVQQWFGWKTCNFSFRGCLMDVALFWESNKETKLHLRDGNTKQIQKQYFLQNILYFTGE
jgi:hypothetical protein